MIIITSILLMKPRSKIKFQRQNLKFSALFHQCRIIVRHLTWRAGLNHTLTKPAVPTKSKRYRENRSIVFTVSVGKKKFKVLTFFMQSCDKSLRRHSRHNLARQLHCSDFKSEFFARLSRRPPIENVQISGLKTRCLP